MSNRSSCMTAWRSYPRYSHAHLVKTATFRHQGRFCIFNKSTQREFRPPPKWTGFRSGAQIQVTCKIYSGIGFSCPKIHFRQNLRANPISFFFQRCELNCRKVLTILQCWRILREVSRPGSRSGSLPKFIYLPVIIFPCRKIRVW